MDMINAADVSRVIDIRLWRMARFVPWASDANLATMLGDARYRYIPELAPTKELLTAYKGGAVDWAGYEKIFNNLMRERRIEKLFTPDDLDGMCLLCSEKTADKCHRRLAAEYLAAHFPGTEIVHLQPIGASGFWVTDM